MRRELAHGINVGAVCGGEGLGESIGCFISLTGLEYQPFQCRLNESMEHMGMGCFRATLGESMRHISATGESMGRFDARLDDGMGRFTATLSEILRRFRARWVRASDVSVLH